MHASSGGRHVSGAERIVAGELIAETANQLLLRAQGRGIAPARTVITIDDLGPERPEAITALDLFSVPAVDHRQGRSSAKQVLVHAGVSGQAIDRALEHIGSGAGPSGQNMRGAMLLDAATGDRLEPDRARGVRASRFDWTVEAEEGITQALSLLGLVHFRTREALALASKIATCPVVAGELCWSDDPDYTAGYAASPVTGYVRFPHLKPYGDTHGGRAVFIRDRTRLEDVIAYLQQHAVLIGSFGTCRVGDLDGYLRTRAGDNVRI